MAMAGPAAAAYSSLIDSRTASQEPAMFKQTAQRLSQQTASFALAAIVTLSMLGTVDQLAAPDQASAVNQAAEQVVTITAQRLS
jgi:hypothetical protein